MKPFDLEAAQRGEPICFGSGAKARFIAYDEKTSSTILAIPEGSGEILCVYAAHRCIFDDLMMYEPIRKQFDYDEYIKNPSGWRLETRRGLKSEFVGYSPHLNELIQVIFTVKEKTVDSWFITFCTKKGKYNGGNYLDIFMIEVTP